MKTANVRDLRNNFARLSKWLENGESVQIFKRGKPVARIVPEPARQVFLGSLEGTGNIPDDLDEPLPVRWKAAE